MIRSLEDVYRLGYQFSAPVLTFDVPGVPIGQGAISSTYDAATKTRRSFHSNGKQLTPWRNAVMVLAKQAMFGKHDQFPIGRKCGVFLSMTFTMPKKLTKAVQAEVDETGEQVLPTQSIDLDHLVRAIGDALKKAGVYEDDNQIIETHARKVYPGEHPCALPQPGARIALCVAEPWIPPASTDADLLAGATPTQGDEKA